MAKYLGFKPSPDQGAYFISYNSEDAGRIRSTAMELYRLGLPLWYDNALKYNEEWPKQIADHIQTAPALLMFISLALLKKKTSYVEIEYDIATKDFDKPILIILLDDIKRADVPNAKKIWWSKVDKLQHLLLDPAWSGQQCAALILEKLGIDPHSLTPPQDISSLRQTSEGISPDGPGTTSDTSSGTAADHAADTPADSTSGHAADTPSDDIPTEASDSPDASQENRPRHTGAPKGTTRTGIGRFLDLILSRLSEEDDYYDDDDLLDDLDDPDASDEPLKFPRRPGSDDQRDDFSFQDSDTASEDDFSDELEDRPLTPGRIVDDMFSSLRGLFARDKEADYAWIASFQRAPDAAAAPDGRLAVLIAVLLMVLGVNLIFTTGYVSEPSTAYYNLLRHVIMLVLGVLAAGLLVFMDPRYLKRIFFILYAATAAGTLARYFILSSSGTRIWYRMDYLMIGGLTFRLSYILLLAFILCLFAFVNEDASWFWPLLLTFVTAVLERFFLQATIQAFFVFLIGLFVLSRYPVPLFRRIFRILVISIIAALILLPIIARFAPGDPDSFRMQRLRMWTDPYSYINMLSPSIQYLLRVFSCARFIGDGVMGNTDLLSFTGPGSAPVFSVILDLYGWVGFAVTVLLFAFLSYYLFRCSKYAYECGYPEFRILLDAVFLHFTLNWLISALSSCLIFPFMWEANVPLMSFGSVQGIFLAELGLAAMSLRCIRKNSFTEVMS